MKYFVIYPDENQEQLTVFFKNNQHLNIEIEAMTAPISNANLRKELMDEQIIGSENNYTPTNLGYTKAHIVLWQKAVETNCPMTIFEENAITNKDFIKHQQHALTANDDYDLLIWGYDLNSAPCLQLMSCLPKFILTFPGNNSSEIRQPSNSLIEPELYQSSDLQPVRMINTLSFAGLGAYTISPKGAEQLLSKTAMMDSKQAPSYQDNPHGSNHYVFKKIDHRDNVSIDIEVNRHLEELMAYLAVPMMAVLPTRIVADTSETTTTP